MTVVNDGRNIIRDLLATALTNQGVGTGQVTVSINDTGLNGNTNLGTAGTDLAVSVTKSDQQLKTEYILPAGTGSGVKYYETGLNDGADLFNRLQYYGKTKDDNDEWVISTTLSLVQ